MIWIFFFSIVSIKPEKKKEGNLFHLGCFDVASCTRWEIGGSPGVLVGLVGEGLTSWGACGRAGEHWSSSVHLHGSLALLPRVFLSLPEDECPPALSPFQAFSSLLSHHFLQLFS